MMTHIFPESAPGSVPGLRRGAAAALIAALAAGAAAVPAGAQTIVVGENTAAACYRHALAGRGTIGALEECDLAVERTSDARDLSASYVNRAIVKVIRGDYSGALVDVDTSERYREFPEADATRGTIYFYLGRYQDAVEQYTIAIESGELDAPYKTYFNRGLAVEELGRIEDAYYDYKMASELAPDWDLPQQELARFTVTPAEGGSS